MKHYILLLMTFIFAQQLQAQVSTRTFSKGGTEIKVTHDAKKGLLSFVVTVRSAGKYEIMTYEPAAGKKVDESALDKTLADLFDKPFVEPANTQLAKYEKGTWRKNAQGKLELFIEIRDKDGNLVDTVTVKSSTRFRAYPEPYLPKIRSTEPIVEKVVTPVPVTP